MSKLTLSQGHLSTSGKQKSQQNVNVEPLKDCFLVINKRMLWYFLKTCSKWPFKKCYVLLSNVLHTYNTISKVFFSYNGLNFNIFYTKIMYIKHSLFTLQWRRDPLNTKIIFKDKMYWHRVFLHVLTTFNFQSLVWLLPAQVNIRGYEAAHTGNMEFWSERRR